MIASDSGDESDRFCPDCAKNGKESGLCLFQRNNKYAAWTCPERNCYYIGKIVVHDIIELARLAQLEYLASKRNPRDEDSPTEPCNSSPRGSTKRCGQDSQPDESDDSEETEPDLQQTEPDKDCEPQETNNGNFDPQPENEDINLEIINFYNVPVSRPLSPLASSESDWDPFGDLESVHFNVDKTENITNQILSKQKQNGCQQNKMRNVKKNLFVEEAVAQKDTTLTILTKIPDIQISMQHFSDKQKKQENYHRAAEGKLKMPELISNKLPPSNKSKAIGEKGKIFSDKIETLDEEETSTQVLPKVSEKLPLKSALTVPPESTSSMVPPDQEPESTLSVGKLKVKSSSNIIFHQNSDQCPAETTSSTALPEPTSTFPREEEPDSDLTRELKVKKPRKKVSFQISDETPPEISFSTVPPAEEPEPTLSARELRLLKRNSVLSDETTKNITSPSDVHHRKRKSVITYDESIINSGELVSDIAPVCELRLLGKRTTVSHKLAGKKTKLIASDRPIAKNSSVQPSKESRSVASKNTIISDANLPISSEEVASKNCSTSAVQGKRQSRSSNSGNIQGPEETTLSNGISLPIITELTPPIHSSPVVEKAKRRRRSSNSGNIKVPEETTSSTVTSLPVITEETVPTNSSPVVEKAKRRRRSSNSGNIKVPEEITSSNVISLPIITEGTVLPTNSSPVAKKTRRQRIKMPEEIRTSDSSLPLISKELHPANISKVCQVKKRSKGTSVSSKNNEVSKEINITMSTNKEEIHSTTVEKNENFISNLEKNTKNTTPSIPDDPILKIVKNSVNTCCKYEQNSNCVSQPEACDGSTQYNSPNISESSNVFEQIKTTQSLKAPISKIDTIVEKLKSNMQKTVNTTCAKSNPCAAEAPKVSSQKGGTKSQPLEERVEIPTESPLSQHFDSSCNLSEKTGNIKVIPIEEKEDGWKQIILNNTEVTPFPEINCLSRTQEEITRPEFSSEMCGSNKESNEEFKDIQIELGLNDIENLNSQITDTFYFCVLPEPENSEPQVFTNKTETNNIEDEVNEIDPEDIEVIYDSIFSSIPLEETRDSKISPMNKEEKRKSINVDPVAKDAQVETCSNESSFCAGTTNIFPSQVAANKLNQNKQLVDIDIMSSSKQPVDKSLNNLLEDTSVSTENKNVDIEIEVELNLEKTPQLLIHSCDFEQILNPQFYSNKTEKNNEQNKDEICIKKDVKLTVDPIITANEMIPHENVEVDPERNTVKSKDSTSIVTDDIAHPDISAIITANEMVPHEIVNIDPRTNTDARKDSSVTEDIEDFSISSKKRKLIETDDIQFKVPKKRGCNKRNSLPQELEASSSSSRKDRSSIFPKGLESKIARNSSKLCVSNFRDFKLLQNPCISKETHDKKHLAKSFLLSQTVSYLPSINEKLKSVLGRMSSQVFDESQIDLSRYQLPSDLDRKRGRPMKIVGHKNQNSLINKAVNIGIVDNQSELKNEQNDTLEPPASSLDEVSPSTSKIDFPQQVEHCKVPTKKLETNTSSLVNCDPLNEVAFQSNSDIRSEVIVPDYCSILENMFKHKIKSKCESKCKISESCDCCDENLEDSSESDLLILYENMSSHGNSTKLQNIDHELEHLTNKKDKMAMYFESEKPLLHDNIIPIDVQSNLEISAVDQNRLTENHIKYNNTLGKSPNVQNEKMPEKGKQFVPLKIILPEKKLTDDASVYFDWGESNSELLGAGTDDKLYHLNSTLTATNSSKQNKKEPNQNISGHIPKEHVKMSKLTNSPIMNFLRNVFKKPAFLTTPNSEAVIDLKAFTVPKQTSSVPEQQLEMSYESDSDLEFYDCYFFVKCENHIPTSH